MIPLWNEHFMAGQPMMSRRTVVLLWVTITAVLAGVTSLSLEGQRPFEWRDYAGWPSGSRFVPLKGIEKSNVSKPRVAWTYPYGETGFNRTSSVTEVRTA